MLIVGTKPAPLVWEKSTTANVFRHNGIQVLDADKVVHGLYEGKAVGAIEAAFPGTSVDGKVDRQKLSAALAQDPSGFQNLKPSCIRWCGPHSPNFSTSKKSANAGHGCA